MTTASELAAKVSTEVVTHSYLTDLPTSAGTIALITLDNDQDHRRPTTLGPTTLLELIEALGTVRQRAEAGEIVGLAITGKPYYLVAGADLSAVNSLETREDGKAMATLGHDAYQLIHELPVPTFAFINGAAMGGGLEIALACDYRTVSSSAQGISLPEAFIGLIPGWSGIYQLPRLIGPEAAMEIVIKNPLSNNRTIGGAQAAKLGIADALFEAPDFLAESVRWAAKVIAGEVTVERPNAVAPSAVPELDGPITDPEVSARWDAAVEAGKKFVAAKTGTAAPAPLKVLEVFAEGKGLTRAESREKEIEVLADLMQSPEFRSTVYAFLDLVQKRGKKPAGAPDPKLATPVTKVGIIGAGLMASQLALVFARNLKVPVVMTDIDQARVDKGVGYVHGEVDKLLEKKRISPDGANRVKALVTGTVDKQLFADADFVIEAVFEEMGVKKQVFAEIEDIISENCILATNTSSLSVAEMAKDLKHPERVIGFHFFNPVAVMPLLEIARTEHTREDVLATAFVTGKALKKTCVLVKDSAAFVVNRILLRLMGEIQKAFDQGTDAATADRALAPMGLPMTPFTLLQMVGIPVAHHVSESLHAAFGDRFWVSENLQKLIDAGVKGIWEKGEDGKPFIPQSTLDLMAFGDNPQTSEQILTTVQDALAEEIGLMLDEGVAGSPEDIDLCMILGAGWPFHLGGITPYLDRVGASERVNGKKFGAI